MARHKEFDVQKALKAAQEAFWEHGYEATSLDDLVRRMGVQRASLYATFGDKRSLFLAALRRYQEESLRALRESLEGSRSPRAALRALFAAFVDGACAKGVRRGCLCVNTSVELAPHDPEIAAAMRRHGKAVEALLAAAVRRGVRAGEFSRRRSPRAVARFLTNATLGLSVTAKTSPGRRALSQIAETTLSVLDP